MRDIAMLLQSPNAPWLMLIVCAAVVYASYLFKTGMVRIKTDKVQIGRTAAEIETVILRRQIEYINHAVNATMRKIPRHDKFDEWRAKYVLEKVIDAMTSWALFNHLDTSDRYVHLKQDEIWDIVQQYTWHEVYQSQAFRQYVDSIVADILESLVDIRQQYGGVR